MTDYIAELTTRGVETFDGAGENEALINCPFHDDEHPSCEVNAKTGLFYCFGCGVGGTFLKLIAEIDGISITEASRRFREGQQLDEVVIAIFDQLQSLEDEKNIPFKYLSKTSFHSVFPPIDESVIGMSYLANRGFTLNTLQNFDLRWGVTGVMRDRVVIPVYTPEGKLLTYSGRAVEEGVQPKTRKVRSSGSTLYGMFHVWLAWYVGVRATSKLPYVVVTEGPMDAMYLMQHGVYAVSTMGTAKITDDQLALLRRCVKEVWWSYDGDAAGQKAQARAIETCRRVVPCHSLTLPKDTDPNELSRKQIKEIYGGLGK